MYCIPNFSRNRVCWAKSFWEFNLKVIMKNV